MMTSCTYVASILTHWDLIPRVGRTARAGRGGLAISLVSERDVELVHAIEEKIGVKMELYEDVEVGM